MTHTVTVDGSPAAIGELTAALARRDGWRVLPGVVVLAGSCFPFMTGHIFHPTGVYAMVGVGVGTALIAAARREPAAVRESADV